MPSFRLGTTSYILPADLLPNARFLAGLVQDIELVLFELDGGRTNLPDEEVAEALADLARARDLTYTVHFPEDLWIGEGDFEAQSSWVKARKALGCTQPLNPWAYILHLDGRAVRTGATPQALRRWQDQAVRALEVVAGWVGDASILAVENLESYPPDFVQPVVDRLPVSRCIDIGHMWIDGHDPIPHLLEALPRTRVVHLHGVDGRDHQSLAMASREQLKAVMDLLLRANYGGVLTIEIFGEADFQSSMDAISQYMRDKT